MVFCARALVGLMALAGRNESSIRPNWPRGPPRQEKRDALGSWCCPWLGGMPPALNATRELLANPHGVTKAKTWRYWVEGDANIRHWYAAGGVGRPYNRALDALKARGYAANADRPHWRPGHSLSPGSRAPVLAGAIFSPFFRPFEIIHGGESGTHSQDFGLGSTSKMLLLLKSGFFPLRGPS